ncbi:hypothetical protein Aperf_G00000030202 [Anoplocephala perfoliata]
MAVSSGGGRDHPNENLGPPICKVTHSELRQLSVDAIILLIKRVIISKTPTTNFWNNSDLTSLVLEPLTQLTDIKFNDVQEKQLQCIQYLVHCYGDEINGSWLRLINIIGAISQSQTDKHIRSAFQCFQLVVTDYLPTLSTDCYPACVNTAAKFGHQEHDLNISLAAIGSMLHLTDFLFQRERGAVESSVAGRKEDGEAGGLWVSVFIHLANLVRDRRPAVRKSAGQTLFNAIECHSAQFRSETWSQLLWTVFFPLLSDVQEKCAQAPAGREGSATGGSGGGGLLVHHSRDTAAKQWAETVVLTLSGVARCFVSKQSQLLALDRFPEAWERLLSNAERAVLTPNSEIAQNALSTLRILLDFNTECPADRTISIWLAFWRTWLSIGRNFVDYFANLADGAVTNAEVSQKQQGTVTRKSSTSTFGSEFFSLYFDLFPPLFPRIETKSFDSASFAEFAEITTQGVLGPLFVSHHQAAVNQIMNGSVSTSTPTTPSFMTSLTTNIVDEQGLTQTQRSVFNCLSLIAESIKASEVNIQNLLVPFLELLLRLSLYAVRISRPGTSADLVEVIPMNYIIFAEKCMELATQMYKNFADSEVICNANGLLKMIESSPFRPEQTGACDHDNQKALRIPLAAKYKCQCRSTWLLASKCFIEIVNVGVPITINRKIKPTPNGKSHSCIRSHDLWNMIFATIRDFLFCQNQPTENLSGEEFQQHEALDCKYIDLICDLFLSQPEGLQPKFLEQLVGILGLGAVEASITAADFALLDPNTLRPALLSNSSDSQSKRSTPSIGALQPFVHRSPSIAAVSAANNCSAVSSSDGDLRPFVSREKFMRRCFEALLAFAFFSPDQETASQQSPTTLKFPIAGANKPHVVLCRTAIRDVLDRCRFILQRFVKSAQMTGKCPLPRARLSEVNFTLQALALLLAAFTTPQPQTSSANHSSPSTSIDASTWSYVIDIYPLVVDCIFVTEASSQLVQGIHRLLQLYGRLLQPKSNCTP